MWPFTKKPPVEDPARLRRFLMQLENADWRASSAASLEHLFAAVNDLIYSEVLFYYKARIRHRIFSYLTRGTSVVLGAAGVIIPLLAAADPVLFKPYAPYGYPLLVAAASLIAINRLFGATNGHIRYVTAQLELERIMTKFRLEWLEWLSRDAMTPGNPATNEQAFKILNDFADRAYRVIQEETVLWGSSVNNELKAYSSQLPKSGSSAGA